MRRSRRLWVCPTKALCAGVVAVTATTAELEQGWPGFPQSLSLVLHNLIMFPVRGLSKSSSRESQAALARGLVVDRSGEPLGLLGKVSPGPLSGARSGLQAEGESSAGKRVGAAIARLWGSSCAPGSSSPHPPRLASGPWGS